MATDLEAEKRLVAKAAAELVEDGMSVGLGTGSTVAFLLPALAERKLSLRCVATSPETQRAAVDLGIAVEEFEDLDKLDIAIDGADQAAPDGWLVKGGGGAHTREKVVAATAERFVVIVDSSKLVDRLVAPVPLELSQFGLSSTLRRLRTALAEPPASGMLWDSQVEVRDAPLSPDGGVIADYRGDIGEPAEFARLLADTPGVIEHGLFPPAMVSEVLVGKDDEVIGLRS